MYATTNGCKEGEGKIEGFPGSGGYDIYFDLDEFTEREAESAADLLHRRHEDLSKGDEALSLQGLAHKTKKNRIKGVNGKYFHLKKGSGRYTITTKKSGGLFGFWVRSGR